jgi:hypothetical protein
MAAKMWTGSGSMRRYRASSMILNGRVSGPLRRFPDSARSRGQQRHSKEGSGGHHFFPRYDFTMLATATEAAILKRVIQPDSGNMSPDAARALLAFQFTESDHARMAELSVKARDGTLAQGEEEELDGYINVSHFIAFVQSKARMCLKSAPLPGAA